MGVSPEGGVGDFIIIFVSITALSTEKVTEQGQVALSTLLAAYIECQLSVPRPLSPQSPPASRKTKAAVEGRGWAGGGTQDPPGQWKPFPFKQTPGLLFALYMGKRRTVKL